MHQLLASVAVLLGGGLLLVVAAPVSREPVKPPNADTQAEAETYAQLVQYTVQAVTMRYVRPVSRTQLLSAALKGLYEAAGEPLPGSLQADLDKAKTDADVLGVLARARAALGNPEPLRNDGALLASCRAMARALDPYSVVVTGEDLRRGNGVDQRQGIGVELADNLGVGPLHIKNVLPGSSAQQAGIRPDDEVTHIDGKPVKGKTSTEALILLDHGVPTESHDGPLPGPGIKPAGFTPSEPAGTTVEVTIRSPGAKKPRTLTLERRSFRPEAVLGVMRNEDNTWDYLCDRRNKIAHIRLGNLGNGAALEFRTALAALQDAGMRGLILDLRWCPGGYLAESVNVASLLLGECLVATVHNRDERDNKFTSEAGDNKFTKFPVVVLINGETSGGAELIAAALQDNHRAKIMGQRTVGKASIQTQIGLPAGNAGLKLTSGTFIRPSGKNLHRSPDSKPGDDWGVRPDDGLENRVSPELGRQLKGWWQQQTLRPGPSNEALPLDDPSADPQRAAALKVLLGMIK
jgi:C-terminal processing protease CtpA/Prc